MTVTFCTSGAVKLKAGVDATTLTDDQYTMLINQAEAYINDACKVEGVDLVTAYSTIGTNYKKIFEDVASSHAAMSVIVYDLTLFGKIVNAQTQLNVNYTRIKDGMAVITDKKFMDYIRSI